MKKLIENPDIKKQKVEEFMGIPLPFIGQDSTIDVISSLLDKEISAVLVRDENNETYIITQHDILMAMTS